MIRRSRTYSRGASGFTNANNSSPVSPQVMSTYLFTVVNSAKKLQVANGAFAYGTDIGNPIVVSGATIGYPSGSGTFYDLAFGGVQGVTVANGALVVSDTLDLTASGGVVAHQLLNVRT